MATNSQSLSTLRPTIYLLKHVQDALRVMIDDALAPLNLTAPQMAVLSALSSQPQLSNAELARATFVAPQSMVPVLQALESQGWIVRRPPARGRTMPAELTAHGRERLKAGRTAMSEVESRLLDGLSADERLLFRELLERCLNSLRPEQK